MAAAVTALDGTGTASAWSAPTLHQETPTSSTPLGDCFTRPTSFAGTIQQAHNPLTIRLDKGGIRQLVVAPNALVTRDGRLTLVTSLQQHDAVRITTNAADQVICALATGPVQSEFTGMLIAGGAVVLALLVLWLLTHRRQPTLRYTSELRQNQQRCHGP